MPASPSRRSAGAGRDVRRREVSPFGEALERFLASSGLAPRLRSARVLAAWNEAAGEALARRARPVAFRAGELVVEVDSSAHLGELRGFTGEDVRRRANERLGSERILRVVYRLPR